MEPDVQNAGNLKQKIGKLFEEALRTTFPDELDVEPAIAPCQNPKYGDYQCNNAMGLWSKVTGKGTQFNGPRPIGEAIVDNLPPSEMIESPSVARAGFINIIVSDHWMAKFGMLIEFLFEKFPSGDVSSDQAIGDLEAFYKASKQRFDSDPVFKERAQRAVVSLQGGEEKYRKAWVQICEISRRGYGKVYQRLGVHLEEKGESFYNPYIPKALKLLNEKGLIEESEDLAALWYRLNEEKAEWIIYVTDVGQREHFEMVFAAAKRAGWLPADDNKYPKASHVGFGLVLGEDGKRFRTRSTETVKLVDLLDEAKSRCREALVQRGKAEEWTAEELDKTAEAVGYGAVKYADLKNNRTTNYTFNFDQMLNDKGNTAVYLLYAHARICSIIRRSGKDVEELKKIGTVELAHRDERVLGLHLLQFPEIVEEACTNLLPSVLCEYLYNLSEDFTRFYTNCQVVGSAEETRRLLLCEATAIVMRKCFNLLGITPVYKI